jgi:hypothetical protein
MKKIDIGQGVQTLANLGVIAGIVFLAVEISQNTESLDEARNLAIAEAQQARAAQLDESYRSLANSEYLPEIFAKYSEEGIEGLTEEERLRFTFQTCSGLFRLATLHAWYELRYVEEEEYDTVFRTVALGFVERWRDLGIAPTRPSFRNEVERLIREAGMSVELPETSAC